MAESVLTPKSRVALHRAIKKGLPFAAFKKLQAESGIPGNRLIEIIQIPARTLERRRHEGRFHPNESERILRLERLVELALRVFDGDRNAAKAWLTQPNLALGNETPTELASTEIGAREVEYALLGIEAGVYA